MANTWMALKTSASCQSMAAVLLFQIRKLQILKNEL